jgi:DNA polymerase-3 subunit epsilon
MTDRLAVLDFETSGSGPDARATEIALVLLEDGEPVQRYASLMHSGVEIPPFIERLTGISTAMLETAPPAREVMEAAHALSGGCPLVAHNAGFDRGFWVRELRRSGIDASAQDFICTVKLARRLYPAAPNHKLGTLARFHGLAPQGRAHRALADALTTALLLQRMYRDAAEVCGTAVDAELLLLLQALPLERWQRCAERVNKARLAKRQLQIPL